jgi:hypothetical protein
MVKSFNEWLNEGTKVTSYLDLVTKANGKYVIGLEYNEGSGNYSTTVYVMKDKKSFDILWDQDSYDNVDSKLYDYKYNIIGSEYVKYIEELEDSLLIKSAKQYKLFT